MKKYTLFSLVLAFILISFLGFNAISANAFDTEDSMVGVLCPNGNTLVSNCTTAPISGSTVILCPNGKTLASNCVLDNSSQVTTPLNTLFKRDLSVGSRGTDVKALQKILKDTGYLYGSVDGSYGFITREAVRKYQKENNITETGIADLDTFERIKLIPWSKMCPMINNFYGVSYPCPTISDDNLPVISGVSGPQSLDVNQQGTWTVTASSSGGRLSYSVIWGDETEKSSAYNESQQSATFTHSYSRSGIYKPTFVVLSENTIRCVTTPCSLNGGRAETSLTVNVGNIISTNTKACSIEPWAINPSGSPKLFNVDFGVWNSGSSAKTGPAIVGNNGDFWNVTAVPWCDAHNKSRLKNADGSSSSVVVEMTNLGGSWSSKPGISDPMLETFSYPQNNQGGNAYVTLNNVPIGNYDLYLYNKTINDGQNGDYTLNVGGKSYGRKMMTTDVGSYQATTWQENNQFVVFRNVHVGRGDKVGIMIQPGVGAYRDSQISGLQLAPTGTRAAVRYIQYQQQTDQAPIISGVSGPQSLNVNQNGTWMVKAYSPASGGNLSYSVKWGDETTYAGLNGSISSTEFRQAATFTHNYSQVGIYNPLFTVTNEKGQTAQTSLSVNVGNTAQTLRVTSPNGEEGWKKGITKNITWTSPRYIRATYADLKLIEHQDCTDVCTASLPREYSIISNISINRNSFSWNVGDVLNYGPSGYGLTDQTIAPDGKYFIKICETGTNNCDSSDSYFTISSSTTAPSLTVLSPNGGERIQKGSTHRISWISDGINQVYIKLRKGTDTYHGLEGSVAYAISNRGYFNWNVPTTLPDGSDYAIRVLSYPNGNIIDDSNSFFTITPESITPSITVLNPNERETLVRGTTKTISWNDTNNISTHDIHLISAGSVYVIANTQGSSFNWTVGSYLSGTVPDGVYTVKVCQSSADTPCGSSNYPITITSPTTVTQCTDSDGGINIDIAGLTDGRVNGLGSYFNDTSVASNGGVCSGNSCTAVAEGYCSNGAVTNYLYQCPGGYSVNGACAVR